MRPSSRRSARSPIPQLSREPTASICAAHPHARLAEGSHVTGRIWRRETHVARGVAAGRDHHGESETGIYVVAGHPEFIYSDGGNEVGVRTKPGDYIYIPPFVHHVESNAHSDEEAVVVIARTTQEAIVENLDTL